MFKLHSEYKPTGDQPEAIEKLVEGIKRGDKGQTLLGVTGSGKTEVYLQLIEKILNIRKNKHYASSRNFTYISNSRKICI